MRSAMKYKLPFTMVEIILALGVCVIGICSIMVLFPIGANASRDAAMETYAANAADQMLNYMKYEITKKSENWNKYIKDGFDPDNTLDTGNPKDEGSSPADLLSTSIWPNSMGVIASNVFRHHSKKGVYQIISSRDADQENMDVSSPNVDFRAIMNVWRDQIKFTTGKPPPKDIYGLPFDMAVQLNVEISWPAALPYPARQKSHYVLEVFNPNFTPH